MAFFVPHDLFGYILSFKDPRYESVRAGNKTPSAQCMPFDPFINDEDLRVPWNGNTLMIWNRGAIVHHGIGQSPFEPSHISGGIVDKLKSFRRIELLKLCVIPGCI